MTSLGDAGGVGVSAPVLVADSLRKAYGRRPALNGLTFSLAAGRILGFLGPNGAGKTTAIRVLTTILPADAGYFSVAGAGSDRPSEIRRRIGVLPESMGFPKGATAFDYLVFYSRMYGFDRASSRERARDLLQEVGLRDRAASNIGTYSRGMRQRLGIARSLVNDPVVVFLDEPTLGLDPRGQQDLLAMISRIAGDRNVAVVLCSHGLDEVEQICDDVVILNHGDVIASGTVQSVIGGGAGTATSGSVCRVRVRPDSVDRASSLLASMAQVEHAMPTDRDKGWIRLDLAGDHPEPEGDGRVNNAILGVLIENDIPIAAFEENAGRLEEVFLQLTQEAHL